MLDTIIEIALVVATIIVVAAAGIAAGIATWQQWRAAAADKRRELVLDAIRRLVEAAEQKMPGAGMGLRRYQWVMTRLRSTFGEDFGGAMDYDEASEHIEATVLALKERRSYYVRRNGARQ